MTPDLALARRAVACRRWEWRAGMLTEKDALGRTWRMRRHGPELGNVEAIHEDGPWSRNVPPLPTHLLPDLSDLPTLGAVLGLAREALREPTLHLRPGTVDRYPDAEPVVVWYVERHVEGESEWLRESGAWGEMEDGHQDPPICSSVEAEALIAALEAAPEAR